jgi:uncharacterized membrane protein YbhN (UPF0104 family)
LPRPRQVLEKYGGQLGFMHWTNANMIVQVLNGALPVNSS